jgi:hypothetical protein
MTFNTGLDPTNVEVVDLDPANVEVVEVTDLALMDVEITEFDTLNSLLYALNPYIDDVLRQPEFHRFMDLPVELRLQIYDHYCHSDKKSLICEGWSTMEDGSYIVTVSPGNVNWKVSAPFLPSLCLANQAIRAEVVPFILRAPVYMIQSSAWAEYFDMKMVACTTIPIGENVLRLVMVDVTTTNYAKIINRCPNVQCLDLYFLAVSPTLKQFLLPVGGLPSPEDFLQDFQVQSLLNSK